MFVSSYKFESGLAGRGACVVPNGILSGCCTSLSVRIIIIYGGGGPASYLVRVLCLSLSVRIITCSAPGRPDLPLRRRLPYSYHRYVACRGRFASASQCLTLRHPGECLPCPQPHTPSSLQVSRQLPLLLSLLVTAPRDREATAGLHRDEPPVLAILLCAGRHRATGGRHQPIVLRR